MTIAERVAARTRLDTADREVIWLRREIVECFKQLKYIEKFAAQAKRMKFKNPGFDLDVAMHVKDVQEHLNALYFELGALDTDITLHGG